MAKLLKILLVIFLVPASISSHAAEPLPAAVKGFCNMAFAGKIARKGQRFNASDVVEKGVPTRRIIAYLIGKRYAYLWYEHGARGYHQHLVKFSTTPPYELKVSYVFTSTTHKDIRQLIKDKRFLASHQKNQCGL